MQAQGREFRATGVEPLPDGLALDLASAYPSSTGIASWRRVARLAGGEISIHDSWQLEPWRAEGAEPATSVQFLIAGEVRVSPGRIDVRPLAGATPLRLEWPVDIPVSSCLRPLDDPMLSTVWGDRLTRIELDVTGRRELLVAVRKVLP
jgi:hypothetical protein